MARKRKHHHEEHVDESWLIPYADMLTLLLALFIVLFAVSSVDAEKYQQLMTVFNENFQGGSGILEHPNPSPLPDAKETQDEPTDVITQEKYDLMSLKQEIDQYITDQDLEGDLQTSISDDGLLLTILDNALFHSGSADVRADAVRLAGKVSELLASDPPRKIVVAGHTDDVPIHNANFRSNWDLSAQRALNFMKILIDSENLDPQNLSATGYGEYQPVASNDTDEGRSKNRRVEVLILPNYQFD
ncbi:flagellar motor protein MotB [Alkalihalobacillus sp. MEB130]|uniref:flagellar motor protein MotB n=1 Tax=Alkalihalobacillus sp. MEB130 TaxID=2976704 RepID=UPI0028DF3539|nr:flagellar motor protein MotB [Alkalihalobacillus sp. MEB130]MDT8858778.1 flagellar motor protein MotB [Alkalihalobacillus sp. MEB130]